ncbi:MAG: hypothetical protein QS748_14780 [Candidatus Endonucleobacter bathymodioli]|uniref:Ankyrin repeats (3 copies) n=1 Tax=Candidatus Endonucleibacter bathymodioli TaxID=539814 RepID=A0AA90NWN0_9GAMM|nr:hypothetical protein [Candidatus Endonucleobacter bathymodioli]
MKKINLSLLLSIILSFTIEAGVTGDESCSKAVSKINLLLQASDTVIQIIPDFLEELTGINDMIAVLKYFYHPESLELDIDHLLNAKTDINKYIIDGRPCLHLLVELFTPTIISKILLTERDVPINMNIIDASGDTPLHRVAQFTFKPFDEELSQVAIDTVTFVTRKVNSASFDEIKENVSQIITSDEEITVDEMTIASIISKFIVYHLAEKLEETVNPNLTNNEKFKIVLSLERLLLDNNNESKFTKDKIGMIRFLATNGTDPESKNNEGKAPRDLLNEHEYADYDKAFPCPNKEFGHQHM